MCSGNRKSPCALQIPILPNLVKSKTCSQDLLSCKPTCVRDVVHAPAEADELGRAGRAGDGDAAHVDLVVADRGAALHAESGVHLGLTLKEDR